MKKLLLLTPFVFLSCISFSQNLSPKVQLIDKDTCFCFTIPQAKLLAIELETHRYCDSILVKTEKQVDTFNQLLTTQDSCLEIVQLKLNNQEKIIEIQEKYIDGIETDLQKAQKQFHSQRWQKELFIMATFIFGTLMIIK